MRGGVARPATRPAQLNDVAARSRALVDMGGDIRRVALELSRGQLEDFLFVKGEVLLVDIAPHISAPQKIKAVKVFFELSPACQVRLVAFIVVSQVHAVGSACPRSGFPHSFDFTLQLRRRDARQFPWT